MDQLFLAIALVAGVGLIAGVGLAIAAKVMHVPSDPRADELLAVLPGANCGACGFAGCAAYANAIAAQDAAVNLCVPGGENTAKALAGIMGVEAQTVAKKRAVVLCGGTLEKCKASYEYRGEQTCAAASMLFSGQKQCNYGCLGFGDCAKKCPENAIEVVDGIARVDRQRCIGCSLCVVTCPKKIITMLEYEGKALNLCSSQSAGAISRKQCAGACIGCKLCTKTCPSNAITVENNLARVDETKCTGCRACIEKCPTKSLYFF
ncbi:MAG: RnfABCDGE type electron transport complex subunit B [Oscillospiraceae bacterium]|jgi:Na+-translocating ferredoxin:NAD+ oxidoreductase RNF subunit RnfB|nr:RnfABCDGE type electron transport complex subunit B [Oscillospiraceae bacterium]